MSIEQTLISNIQSQPQVTSKKSQSNIGNTIASKNTAGDSVNLDMSEVYKSLTILGDKVIAKLNEILKKDLPDGIQSLNPAEQTPEKTSDRIVSGVVGLFPAYAAQNKDLEGEELINKFMEVVKGGIKEGYGEATKILETLGAMEFDSVQTGIEETMKLVEEKLNAFAAQLLGSKSSEAEGENTEAKEQETVVE